jgi:hypothetical protein
VELGELKATVTVLKELGLSYEETLKVMKEFTEDLRSTKSLWKGDGKSRLIRIGLTMIAFPEPTPISETLGVFVLSLGLIQNRIRKSTLHVEDLYSTFQEVNKNILRIKQELV